MRGRCVSRCVVGAAVGGWLRAHRCATCRVAAVECEGQTDIVSSIDVERCASCPLAKLRCARMHRSSAQASQARRPGGVQVEHHTSTASPHRPLPAPIVLHVHSSGGGCTRTVRNRGHLSPLRTALGCQPGSTSGGTAGSHLQPRPPEPRGTQIPTAYDVSQRLFMSTHAGSDARMFLTVGRVHCFVHL
jgi:hypothetical protein